MKTIELHQVDTFTNIPFGGNPAGVVTNADGLSDDEMKKIAREMNLSETGFVLRPTVKNATVKLRFFTPSGDEIKFCGHAAIGALFQLAKLKRYGLGGVESKTVYVETNAGILPMTVTESDRPMLSFTAPRVAMRPFRLQGDAFAKEFGVPAELIKKDSKILLDGSLNYLYIPATSLEILGKQVFDFGRIRERFGKEKIVVFCLFTDQTVEDHTDLHARGLAPNVGVDEDPFTGSMQAGLVHAAKFNGLLPSAQRHIRVEQGHFIGRPGFVEMSHDISSDELVATAQAVQVFSTTMEL